MCSIQCLSVIDLGEGGLLQPERGADPTSLTHLTSWRASVVPGFAFLLPPWLWQFLGLGSSKPFQISVFLQHLPPGGEDCPAWVAPMSGVITILVPELLCSFPNQSARTLLCRHMLPSSHCLMRPPSSPVLCAPPAHLCLAGLGPSTAFPSWACSFW